MELCLIVIKSVEKCIGHLDLAFCVACMMDDEIIILSDVLLKNEILTKRETKNDQYYVLYFWISN